MNLLFIEKKILSECNETSTQQVLCWLNRLYLFPGTTCLEHLLIFQKHDGNLLAALHCLQRVSSAFDFCVYFMTGLNLKLMELGEKNTTKKLNKLRVCFKLGKSKHRRGKREISADLSFRQKG